MDQARFEAWFNGALPDDELTMDELKWIQKRTFKAVEKKVAERKDIFAFSAHKTLQ